MTGLFLFMVHLQTSMISLSFKPSASKGVNYSVSIREAAMHVEGRRRGSFRLTDAYMGQIIFTARLCSIKIAKSFAPSSESCPFSLLSVSRSRSAPNRHTRHIKMMIIGPKLKSDR
jgi:hypothetical protein